MAFHKNLVNLELLKFCLSFNRTRVFFTPISERLQTVLFRADWKTFSIRQQAPIWVFHSCENTIYIWSDGFTIWTGMGLLYSNSAWDK